MIVWVIGLSGAGKSTLANEIVTSVQAQGGNIVLLDGDMVRDVFENDLGYSMGDRLINAKRICQLGKLLDDQGINVVCAILSLFPETRDWNRKNLKQYYEVFIETPIQDLIERDSKGVYGKYNKGEICDVAGMDLEFPVPQTPDLIINNCRSKEKLLSFSEPIVKLILDETS